MTPQQLKAMKLALEALRNYAWHGEACPQHPTYSEPENYPKCTCGFDKVITAIEEALAEHAMQEVQRLGQEIEPVQFKCVVTDDQHPNGIPLEQWAKPPLTDKRVWTFWDLSGGDIADAIKAKLKEKNT